MPRLPFLRTPTEAEAGPGHPYIKGLGYHVPPLSARRWVPMDMAGLAPLVNKLVDGYVAEEQSLLEHEDDGGGAMAVVAAVESEALAGGALVAVEAGGAAPPIMIGAERRMQHVGHGMYHV